MGADVILEQAGKTYLRGIDRILPELKLARYTFLEAEEYKRVLLQEPARGAKIYWSEILFRAHLAAATSIVRSRRWVDGVLREAAVPNFLVFAAAMRGLLESAADTTTALGPIPETLAQHHRSIADALAGRARELIMSSQLEDALIHYSHATRIPKGKQAPHSHRVKTTQEYLSILERGGVPKLHELYAFLCDTTHPGAASVHYLLHHEDGSAGSVGWLAPGRSSDRRAIQWLAGNFGEAMTPILMFAFNPGIVTLRVLNSFSLPEIHTPILSDWHLEDIALWRKCSLHLGDQGTQR